MHIFESIIEAARESVKAETVEIGGENFLSRKVFRIPPPDPEPSIPTIQAGTLAAVVDYLADSEIELDKLYVNVCSPTKVSVFSRFHGDAKQRDTLIEVTATTPSQPFGNDMSTEDLIVWLQTRFTPEGDRDKLLEVAGNLVFNESIKTEDDGVTQTVAVSAGITRAAEATVPNPVTLHPFRTFTDIAQPGGLFVFRLNAAGSQIYAAIHEGDGGAWRNEATAEIAKYLKTNIDGRPTILG